MGVQVEGSIVFGWFADGDEMNEYCDKMGAPESEYVEDRIAPYLPKGMTCECTMNHCRDTEYTYYLVLKVADMCTLAKLGDIDPKAVERARQFMAEHFDESKEPLYIATVNHS